MNSSNPLTARRAERPRNRPAAAWPMLAAVHGRMAQTVDAGMGDLDWSAMAVFLLD
ncbi:MULTISPECIES: hypothetical protein [unclassified Paraburkholderia]|uniref:hypothetical protein n=1 Tax=unclassified Paraburkholderia TaxID=2615204 RepID=UPI002AB1D7A8|nr:MULTISPECIES: hypothetical protein [unclassified Paraburkholderia]